MILDIVEVGEPVLRRKAHKIGKIDKDIRMLADDMLETMRDSNGVGLAGPQVGEMQRIIVVEYADKEEDENAPVQTFKVINPEIVWHSEEKETCMEGCLSVPGVQGTVSRYESVRVRGLNTFGRPININASGFLARIFQHEIDHLNGILYTDIAEEIFEIDDDAEVETDQPTNLA